MTKQTPCIVHQVLCLAVTASKQVHERVMRQRLDGMFLRMGIGRIGQAAILDKSVRR